MKMFTGNKSHPVRLQRIHVAACHLAWLIWCGGLGAGTAAAAPAVFPDATHQGSNASLSLSARFTPDTDHANRDLRVFALAWVPSTVTASGPQGRWYARSVNGWIPVQAGQIWPEALALPSGAMTQPVTLLSADDMRPFMGAQIYLGYGLSSGDTASAMGEMLTQRRYRQIYTVNQSPSDTGRSNTDVGLKPADTHQLQSLFAQVQKNIVAQDGWVTIKTGEVLPTTAAPSVAPNGVNVSGTTLQETGVDEDDLVKSDGVFLYSLNGSTLTDNHNPRDRLERRRFQDTDVQLSTPESLPLPWSKGVVGTGLILNIPQQQAIAIGQGGMHDGIYDMWFTPSYWQSGVTELAIADTTDALQVKRHLRLNGTLIGSRRIGSVLYLVLRSYPQWPISINRNLITQKSTSDIQQNTTELPALSLDQGPAQPLVNAEDCLISENKNTANLSADIITLMAIDLAYNGHKHTARCFVGNTEAFYFSQRNVYLATTRSTYTYSGRFPVYPQNTYTDIHQFSLNGLEMNYIGSGSVSGHLGFDQNRKSFRMGEYNGVLRVFSQTAQRFGGWVGLPRPVLLAEPVNAPASTENVDSPGKLTLLQVRDGALATVGELPNAKRPAPLGKPGEQLYASRFIGNRGYLVTYRLTDPLYIVDLTDPTDPQVLGELEVSGYSDYLFPLSDTLLMGVGKEAISDGGTGDGRSAWYQGVKLSLIDISNPAKPVEADRSVIGKRGTDATVLHDHHGIALQMRTGTTRFSLPVALHDSPGQYTTGKPNDYYAFTRNELQKWEVDLNNKTLKARTPLTSPSAERDIGDDRSVLWNDQVHYYTGNKWISAPW